MAAAVATPALHAGLQAEQLHYRYDAKEVLQEVSLQLAPGELIALIGPNGAGKSSLLKLLAGLLTPQHGRIQLDGKPLNSYGADELARRRAYLAQGAPLHWPLTVRQLVALGRLPWRHGALPADDAQHIDAAMVRTEISAWSARAVTSLSEGERMRVMFARLLATRSPLLLADEPTAALDLHHQHHTMQLFRQHCAEGGSALVVLHDLNLAARYCDRLILLDRGRVVTQGNPETVLTVANLNAVYRVDAQVLKLANVLQVLVAPSSHA